MINNNTRSFAGHILFLTTITSFMTAFMGSSLNIALPVIGREFGASAILISWLSTVYLLTTAALLLPSGRFADIRGRVKSFKSGIILFTSGSFLCSIVPDPYLLMTTRAVQGIGASLIFATSTAILVSEYPVSYRGKALGINVASVYTGLSSGPFLGGLITHYWNWRAIFLINAFLGIIISILTYKYLKLEEDIKSDEKYDRRGAVVYIFSIILLMTGLSFFPKLHGYLLFIAGAAFLIMFYFMENSTEFPLVNFSVFRRNRTFIFSNTAALINYSATFAIGFLMSFYLQTVKNLTPQEAGLVLIIQPVVQAIFSPLSGRMSDKYEPQLVASAGMGILTIGLILFCFLSPGTGIPLISLNLAFLGLGFALFSSPNTNAVMSSVEKKYYGIASSALSSMRNIGMMLSMGIVMMIFNIYLGSKVINAASSGEFLASMRTAFILFSILSLLGIFASLSRGRIHKKSVIVPK